MKRFEKQLLIGTMTLGLLAPIASSSMTPITNTVNAKSKTTKTSQTHSWMHKFAIKAAKHDLKEYYKRSNTGSINYGYDLWLIQQHPYYYKLL